MRVRPGPFIGPLVLSESRGGLNQHQVVPEGTEFDTCPLSSTSLTRNGASAHWQERRFHWRGLRVDTGGCFVDVRDPGSVDSARPVNSAIV